MPPNPRKETSRRSDLGVPETARTLRVMPQHIYNLITAGILKAEKIDNKWRVDAESVRERQRTVNDAMATTRRNHEEIAEPESRAAP